MTSPLLNDKSMRVAKARVGELSDTPIAKFTDSSTPPLFPYDKEINVLNQHGNTGVNIQQPVIEDLTVNKVQAEKVKGGTINLRWERLRPPFTVE